MQVSDYIKKASTNTITAIFSGTGSYGSSTATTGLVVGTVSQSSGTVQPIVQTQQDYTMLLYAILVAVVVAIILSLIVIFRKR